MPVQVLGSSYCSRSKVRSQFYLCADDYAISRGVSEGILCAASKGVISGASAMTNGHDWRQAAVEWVKSGLKTQLGLHLNLTSGKALTLPEFCDQGMFPPLRLLAKRLRQRRDHAGLRREIKAQIDAFMAEYGSFPAFIDGHQHVQILPVVGDELLEVLLDYSLPNGFWLRNSADRFWPIVARGGEGRSKALVVATLGHRFARKLLTGKWASNEGFAGFSLFRPDRDYGKNFEHYLQAAGKRHLIMCHPGFVDEELKRTDLVTITREQELAFLLSQHFSDLLSAGNWQLSVDLLRQGDERVDQGF